MEPSFILEVFIKPNAKIQKTTWDKDVQKFVVAVKSAPEKGKANKEAQKLLKEYFKASKVHLLKGYSSTTKLFEITGAKNHYSYNEFSNT